MHINILRRHQRESIKSYISPGCDLIIQLSDRSTAEISRIFIFCVHILNRCIDPLKIRICDDCFSSQYQSSLICDLKRNILEGSGIVGNDLSYNTVSTGNCLHQFSMIISQNNRKSVHFPGKQRWMRSDKSSQGFSVLCFIQRKHGRFMGFFRQCIHCFISYINSRTVCQNDACFRLHAFQLIVQIVVLSVAHDLPVFLIVSLCCLVQFFYQFFHLVYG